MVAERRAGGPRSRHERPREGERNEIGGAGAVAVNHSSSAQSSVRSWLPLSDRADRLDGPLNTSTVRLAKRDGTKLRDDVAFPSMEGVEAVSWGEATDRWAAWYDDQRDTAMVVENEEGDRTSFRTPNRFTPEYREMLYAKAQSLERGLRDRWGSLLHTAMLSLTASSEDAHGNPRPPVEHHRDLFSSWEAVRRDLHRTLDGREWEYLAILEPHESGYVHVHIGVFVKGPVVAEQFQSVLDTHVRNCPTASRSAHKLHEQVEVRQASHPSRAGGIENLGAYLAAYMAGEYGEEATAMPDYVQRFYATLWATGAQWFRPSNGAQELMQPDEDDEEEGAHRWRLIGLAPNGDPDEEIIEVDPEAGGVTYRTLRTDRPPPAD